MAADVTVTLKRLDYELRQIADAPNYTGLYKTLMEDYLNDTILAYADWKATFHTTNQITNKTTGKNKDEHIESNTTEENNNLRDELLQDARQFEKKMIGWLKDNFEDIPELCDVPEDKIHQSIRPANNNPDYNHRIGIV